MTILTATRRPLPERRAQAGPFRRPAAPAVPSARDAPAPARERDVKAVPWCSCACVREERRTVRGPACKPGSVPAPERGDGHFSSPPVARRVQRPTRRSVAGRTSPAPIFGLAPGGVCRAGLSPGRWCALTRTFSPLPDPAAARAAGHRRYAFCCTFPILCRRPEAPASDGGCYPSPCPAEPGLSSPRTYRAATVRPTREPSLL